MKGVRLQELSRAVCGWHSSANVKPVSRAGAEAVGCLTLEMGHAALGSSPDTAKTEMSSAGLDMCTSCQ